MSSHKIYAVEHLGPSFAPFIVTTAFQNAGGYYRGEWFLVFQEEKDSFFGQSCRFNCKSFPEGITTLDEAFVHQEMLARAKRRLRVYIFENKLANGLGVQRWNPSLAIPESDPFAQLWVRNACREQLTKMFHATECDELRDAIHSVSSLDPYESKDL